MSSARAYNSPVREEKARETREAILTALFTLMDADGAADEITTEAIAEKAGVQRRTVFRHFATKDGLLAAFWPWLNARIGAITSPQTLQELLDGPRTAFPRFDQHEAAMRVALHSRTGRDMRMGTIPDRRRHFAHALNSATAKLPAAETRRIEALAHLLFSVSAWEVLKDYGGLDGAQAGETASWALELILSAVGQSHPQAGVSSKPKEKSNDD